MMVGTVYAAIGDVHGRFDLLEPLYDKIMGHLHEDYPVQLAKRIVFLGDYVDRGPYSRQVLDFLLQVARRPAHIILPGNHEQLMWEFVSATEEDDLTDAAQVWFANGGLATLASYIPDDHPVFEPKHQDNELVLADARDAVPSSHTAFLNWILNGKPIYHYDEQERLFFVHAGIEPSKPLVEQRRAEFLWSRHKNFLRGDVWAEGMTVVHGHTISDQAVVLPGRIGIDTGAFQTGRLTGCLLHGGRQRLLVENEISNPLI